MGEFTRSAEHQVIDLCLSPIGQGFICRDPLVVLVVPTNALPPYISSPPIFVIGGAQLYYSRRTTGYFHHRHKCTPEALQYIVYGPHFRAGLASESFAIRGLGAFAYYGNGSYFFFFGSSFFCSYSF